MTATDPHADAPLRSPERLAYDFALTVGTAYPKTYPDVLALEADLLRFLRAALEQREREIATLRAALDGLAEVATDVYAATIDRDDNYCFSCHDTLPCAHDALRAALAQAKEATDG
jgi:hypothetical protein